MDIIPNIHDIYNILGTTFSTALIRRSLMGAIQDLLADYNLRDYNIKDVWDFFFKQKLTGAKANTDFIPPKVNNAHFMSSSTDPGSSNSKNGGNSSPSNSPILDALSRPSSPILDTIRRSSSPDPFGTGSQLSTRSNSPDSANGDILMDSRNIISEFLNRDPLQGYTPEKGREIYESHMNSEPYSPGQQSICSIDMLDNLISYGLSIRQGIATN